MYIQIKTSGISIQFIEAIPPFSPNFNYKVQKMVIHTNKANDQANDDVIPIEIHYYFTLFLYIKYKWYTVIQSLRYLNQGKSNVLSQTKLNSHHKSIKSNILIFSLHYIFKVVFFVYVLLFTLCVSFHNFFSSIVITFII